MAGLSKWDFLELLARKGILLHYGDLILLALLKVYTAQRLKHALLVSHT